MRSTSFHIKLVIVVTCLFVSANALAAPCSEDDAMNKMMALNRAISRMMASGPMTPDSPGVKLTQESGPASELIAAKKFDEACAEYDKLAAKYKVDLKGESKGLLTMDDLRKDGGKRGGECSIADASKRMMEMHGQIQDQVALGDADGDALREFGKDTAPFGELMVTDPSEVCRQLEGLKGKYKLQ